jgi:serine protease Do
VPLVNLHGELIGINVAVYKEGQGIGFAIPVREVSKALSQFVSPEIASSKWFGAWLKGGMAALVVGTVQPASPAEKAGLRPGMEITQVNGHPTHGMLDFLEYLTRGSVEDLTLTVSDNGASRSIKVKLEPFEDLVKRRTGLGVRELTSAEATRLGLSDGEGLIIESVEHGSPAERAELKAGMLVTAFDTTAVNQLRDLGFALINKSDRQPANFTVRVLKSLGGPYVQSIQAQATLALRQP